MTEHATPTWGHYARAQLWRSDNPAGVRLPPRSMLSAWEAKMSPGVFDANGWARRHDRGTYRRRLANRLVTAAGVVMWCCVVIWTVWGVTT